MSGSIPSSPPPLPPPSCPGVSQYTRNTWSWESRSLFLLLLSTSSTFWILHWFRFMLFFSQLWLVLWSSTMPLESPLVLLSSGVITRFVPSRPIQGGLPTQLNLIWTFLPYLFPLNPEKIDFSLSVFPIFLLSVPGPPSINREAWRQFL